MLLKILYCLCIVLQIIFVPLFLKAQWPGICRKSLFFKMICATSFLSMGVLSINIVGNKSTYAIIMLVGLVFGWLGDLFLHLNDTAKSFAIGFCSFLVGHIVYITAYIKTLPVMKADYNPYNIYEIAVSVSIFILGIVLIKVFKVDIHSVVLKIGCFIYGLLLIGMFVKASSLGLNFWLNGGKYGILAFLVLSIGSLCFMLSDASLGIIMFGGQKRNKPLKVFNIATYFLAQSLLASSILFINA
jgi:uncharacterized membrane protein YhhN